jgi:hypothetical protein
MDPIIKGDLYQQGRPPAEVAMALANLLEQTMPQSKFSVISRTTSTSWTLEIGIVGHDSDLSNQDALEKLKAALRASAERFILDKSVRAADHIERTFNLMINVHEDYWSKRQAKALSPRFKPLGPANFHKALTVGDRLRDTAANLEYVVLSKSAGRFVTDNGQGFGRKEWHVPRAAALRIDGNQLRFAQGSLKDPDKHLLLDWIKH